MPQPVGIVDNQDHTNHPNVDRPSITQRPFFKSAAYTVAFALLSIIPGALSVKAFNEGEKHDDIILTRLGYFSMATSILSTIFAFKIGRDTLSLFNQRQNRLQQNRNEQIELATRRLRTPDLNNQNV